MVEKSRVEILREQKKKIAEQITQALVVEGTKKRKLEKREQILLGVMFQGLIAEGAISTQVFEGAVEKYLKSDKDRERCDAYFERHRFQASEIESTDAGLTEEEGMAIGDTILDEGLMDIDIEPI